MDSIRPKEVIVFFRTQGKANVNITLNGQSMTAMPADYPALYNRCRSLKTDEYQYAATVPTQALVHGYNTIMFESKSGAQPITIRRVELTLNYGDVETHGYF